MQTYINNISVPQIRCIICVQSFISDFFSYLYILSPSLELDYVIYISFKKAMLF